MYTSCGSPRKLTDAQILRVLRWHAQGLAFRAVHGTARSLAQRLGVSVHAVRRALRPEGGLSSRVRGSSARRRPGPSTQLDSTQRLIIKRWHAAYRRFLATRWSAARLAQELGVSRFTVYDCIRRQGGYTQVHRAALQRVGREAKRVSSVSHSSPATSAAEAKRPSALLNAWPRVQGSVDGRYPDCSAWTCRRVSRKSRS